MIPQQPLEFCSVGSPANLSGTGIRSWTCKGQNGGKDNEICLATQKSTVDPSTCSMIWHGQKLGELGNAPVLGKITDDGTKIDSRIEHEVYDGGSFPAYHGDGYVKKYQVSCDGEFTQLSKVTDRPGAITSTSPLPPSIAT